MNEDRKAAELARRRQRLAAALRENLRRRKAKARGRAAGADRAEPPHDSAGIGAHKAER